MAFWIYTDGACEDVALNAAYATREEADQAVADLLADTADAVARGYISDAPDTYRIVEAPAFWVEQSTPEGHWEVVSNIFETFPDAQTALRRLHAECSPETLRDEFRIARA